MGDDIFGEPALLGNEDREAYRRLRAAVLFEMQPQTFFDRLEAREHIDRIWEEFRLKRTSAAIIDGTRVEALSELLSPYFKGLQPSPGLTLKQRDANLNWDEEDILEENDEALQQGEEAAENQDDEAETFEDGEEAAEYEEDETFEDDEEDLEDDGETTLRQADITMFMTATVAARGYYGADLRSRSGWLRSWNVMALPKPWCMPRRCSSRSIPSGSSIG